MTMGLITIAAFLVGIGILVGVHEYGHFWVARRLGFKVLRFSIGFGKPILLRRGRDGIEYALGAIPIGGYVRLADEREAPVAAEDSPRAFNRRPVWQRVLVLVAGAAANFVFAVFAYWILFMHGIPGLRPVVGAVRADSYAAHAGLLAGDEIVRVGKRSVATREATVLEMLSRLTDDGQIEFGLKRGETVRSATISIPAGERRALTEPGSWSALGFGFTVPISPPVLGVVVPGGAAAAAGLKPGDRITAIDGHRISDFSEVRNAARPHAGTSMTLEIERGVSHLTVSLVPRSGPDPENSHAPPVGLLGLQWAGPMSFPAGMETLERYGPVAAAGAAAEEVGAKTSLTLKFLWRMVTGRVSIKNVSGPLGIANYAGISAREGWATYLEFLALISVSLGILNLLPVPILDGGQVVYQLVEGITRRPVPERVQILGQQIGIVLLLLLMSLAFYNDIAWQLG